MLVLFGKQYEVYFGQGIRPQVRGSKHFPARRGLSFYESELVGMKKKELRIQNELRELEKQKKKYQNQLNTGQVEGKATSEIDILVKANKQTKTFLEFLTWYLMPAGSRNTT
ncbi:MAG: hypothetical protein AAF824_06745 [Bacteroidota bacterium]